MKKQLHFITIILIMAGMFSGYAQEIKKGEIQGDYYVVTDSIDGRISKFYYNSEKAYLNSLEKRDERIEELKEKKRIYESNQRTELAKQIEQITDRVNNKKTYTKAMAQRDKESTAEDYAKKISAYNEFIDAQLKFEEVERNYVMVTDDSGVKIFTNSKFEINIGKKGNASRKTVSTSSGLTAAFGYNFINGNDLGIDDFSYGNNNYFSLGFNWKTALNKSQTIRFKYGFEYQTQGTELNGNRSFTISDPNNTQIERLNFNADKAKFRQDQLVFPVHFEIGGTERKEYEDGRVRYNEYDQFKFGIGGYAGINLRSQLKYKYELENEDIKQITVNAFDNNIFVYGVDAYVGFDSWTLFGRMALNDIFKSGSVDAQYVAFGIRLQ
jgi:hypothetical protein